MVKETPLPWREELGVGDAKGLLSLLVPPSPDPSPRGGGGILLSSAFDVEMELSLSGILLAARPRAEAM
jgi:hypothetical protein